MDFKKFLQVQIEVQRKNMRIALYCSLSLILIGIFFSSFFVVMGAGGMGGNNSDLMKLGPLCITGAGASFPLRSYLAYRTRISTYEFLLRCCESVDAEKDHTLSQAILDALKGLLKLE